MTARKPRGRAAASPPAESPQRRRPAYRSEAPGSVVHVACRERVRGKSYAEIVEFLRGEFEECGAIKRQTVAKWSQEGRGGWDLLCDVYSELRAEELAKTPNIENAQRLVAVRRLIARTEATLLGEASGEGAPFSAEELNTLKIRPDTFLIKLRGEERELTRGDLSRVPRNVTWKIVRISLRELVAELVRRRMVSEVTVSGQAASIAEAVTKRMPHLLEQEASVEELAHAAEK